jgi:hypothetical protein
MTDYDGLLRERVALEDGRAAEEAAAPIRIGRFAPYPVWMTLFVIIRGAQVMLLACVLWAVAAVIEATDGRALSLPPLWLWIVLLLLGAGGKKRDTFRLSPAGDLIGYCLASLQCPACGRDVFDHTPASGYAPEVQKHALLPSSVCSNCGHDLAKRTAT